MSPEWVDEIMDELDTSPQMKEAFRKACDTKGLKIPDINNIFAIIKDTKDNSLIGQLVSDATQEVSSFIGNEEDNSPKSIYKTFIDLGLEPETVKRLADLDISKSNHGAGKFEALLLCCLKGVEHGDSNQADIIGDGYTIEVKVNNSRIGGTEKTASESVRFLEKTLRRKYNIDIDIPDDFFVKESNVDWTEVKKAMNDSELFDLLVQSMQVQYIHLKQNDIVISNEIKSDVITSQGVNVQALLKLRFALALKNYAIKKNLTHILAIRDKGMYRFYNRQFLDDINAIYQDETIEVERPGDTGKNEWSSQQMKFNF